MKKNLKMCVCYLGTFKYSNPLYSDKQLLIFIQTIVDKV